MTTWLPLVLAVVTFATPVLSVEPRVVCYYTNWSVYRPGTARFNPQNINPYLCTHLVYAFGGFTKDNTLKPFDKYQDIEKGGYAKFTGLKTYNKNLKTMLAIGGWNEGSSRFSPMVASRDRRKEFVRNAIKFLRQNHFDGLDLDWEYPAFRDGGKPKDRENYAKLVKELREEFERESEKTGKPRLLLTMAVPAGIEYIEKGFDIETLNKQIYTGIGLVRTGACNAALKSARENDYTIKFYLENGADPKKLVLGIPTYGRSYTLFNPDAVEIGSPADGPGEQGDATREKGYLAYYEICEALKPKQKKRSISSDSEEYSDEEEEEDEEWTVMHPNPTAMGPVAFKGNQWVGYDDINIVKKKAEYVAENGLGGIMFWSIDNDDFRGNCHGKPYPLIEAAKESYIQKLGSTDNTIVSERPKSRKSGSKSGRRNKRPRTTSTTTTTTTTTEEPSTRSTDNTIVSERPKSRKSGSKSGRRNKRPRTTSTTTTTTTTTEEPSTRSNKRKSGSATSTTPAWNVITPEPPTTPDPGSDFKCTDEGFFPHPRDCKKYFWCLDSGPSDLGIVAHQFTCPSGLYFNKAADSCDFARNVLCKVSAATTKAPTKAPTTRTTVTTTTTTTTRKPLRISTRNSLLFRTSTTPAPQEEEYEDEDDEDNTADDAEDPKVIKELIDLIRKVGGVEQLEKQLGLSETSISTSSDVATSTPSSFNKKLYQKVLERARGRGKFNTNGVTGSQSQNSRSGPQNEGLQPTADQDRLLKKDRPQYVTINRSRPPTSVTTANSLESEEIEDEQESEEQLTRGRSAGVQSKVATTSKPLQYVNIRRSKPTTTVPDTDDDQDPEAVNSLDIASARRENIPEYVTIRRSRPTTESTTAQYQNSETEVESQESALEREITSSSLQPQYTSVLRIRSTTLPPLEEPSSPEPTTVLAVQISSLLNSPTAAEVPSSEPLSSISITTQEIEVPTTTATSPTTTTLPTTPSASTTTETPSTTTSRRGLRRRGSTTASTATPSSPTSTTQVSARNYNFIRRRKPLTTPNEITSESEENVLSRKIRSTTPNSREVEGIKQNSEYARNRRYRTRYQPSVDDSLPAAASPVSANNFGEKFNGDEGLSLISVDVDAPLFVRRDTNSEGIDEETSSTEIDEVPEDSEVSATTVEDKRPTNIFRGRGRYTTITTTEAISQSTTTESAFTQRRPSFARFTPRPFARPTLRPSNNRERSEGVISPRIPLRASFGRARLSTPTPNNAIGIQPRRLPFPSRSRTTTTTTTTEQTFTTEIDDEDLENKRDDIYLSESAIEEKEHKDENEGYSTTNFEDTEKLTNNRFSTTESYDVGETVTSDTGTRKFKVIRRRPTKTTVATETTSTADFTDTTISTVPRLRKVIRKKIKQLDSDVETTTKKYTTPDTFKEITKLAFNYGEKTKSTTMTPTTTESQDVEDLPIEPKFESNKQQPKLKGNDSSQETQPKPANEDETILKTDEDDNSQNDQLTRIEGSETTLGDETASDSEVNSKDNQKNPDTDTKEDKVLTEDDESDNMAKFNENNNATVSDQNDNLSDNVEITTFENKTDIVPDFENMDNLKETDDTISNNNENIDNTKSENQESDNRSESETNAEDEASNGTITTTLADNAEVVIDSDRGIDLSEKSEYSEGSLTQANDTSEIEPITTTSTTTSPSSSVRTRLPYRPPKRLFTSTTESSLPSSSRTFSRKYNPGAYTSPATVEREPFRPSVTRRPLFSRTFTRKPFTARTTKRVEEDEYSDEELLEEEGLDEEAENPFVFVPPSQLFTRKPDSEEEYEDEGNDEFEDGLEEEEIYDEEQVTTPQTTTIGRFTTTSRRPLFRPRVVNSNTFRTSTTTTELPNTRANATQLPKRTFTSGQNKTAVYNRFSSNKPVNDTKKRVQNVPIGYNAPKATSDIKNTTSPVKVEEKVTTVSPDASDSELTTIQNEIYTSSNNTTSILIEAPNDEPATTMIESQPTTDPIEVNTDEYLVNSDSYVTKANSEDTQVQIESIPMTTEPPTTFAITTLEPDKEIITTSQVPDTTTNATPAPPIVKTQFNKLFSVSRVVEVSSKQDKHHINKNNETTSIEEGPIVIEKKPTVDKIGEVSRFTLIKIVEDEIPIYLTKLGHVYPVDNPPNNPIRIDEGRNARSLGNYYNYPKESLVASESMNEAYRHIKEFSEQHKEPLLKREVEHISDDDFLSYVNEDKKVEMVKENHNYQFIPAANPSTLSLEGLFKTASPVTPNKNSDTIESQPFFVYSVADPTESTKKVELIKSEISSASADNIKKPKVEQYTTLSPKHIVKPTVNMPTQTSDKNITASPVIDILSRIQPTSATESKNVTTTPEPLTTSEIKTTESSTPKTLSRNNKNTNFPFIRRPNLKISNLTRTVETPRTAKKISTTVKTNSIQKSNKTSTFTPSKSRFTANRAQNIPVDTRKKSTASKFVPKITTETPKLTTVKKTFVRPTRQTFRPAFIPRRSKSTTNKDLIL
ncbi:Acidic mammalian chitinase [Papilio machaon]|uniref:Acidic mammalian chitinase n=1 Tax=Papilio machaon TaxID=76193 RepID=A0A0N1INA4_PAPMA|nr:Acidic mammalian chitinase [Papilio machaon]